MSVHLNGVKVPGRGVHVSASLTLDSEDLSGNSSSTAKAEKGDKPKSVIVRLTIPFKSPGDLKQIVDFAESRSGSTERMVFNIINDTAAAMGIRQVVFDGSLQVTESDSLRQWEVNFSLAEHRSVPEKKQERAKAKAVAVQKAAGNGVAGTAVSGGGSGGSVAGAAADSGLSWFETNVLKPANDYLKKQ